MFLDELKLAEVVPVYKKNDKKDKSNYRPISILSNISKIYKRCIQTQLNEYFPRNSKTENRSTFSECLNILFGVPQGSILGPLLFLIFIADLFYLNHDLDFASYADDTTPYICGQDFSSIINVLEPNVNTLFNWFPQNGLIAN